MQKRDFYENFVFNELESNLLLCAFIVYESSTFYLRPLFFMFNTCKAEETCSLPKNTSTILQDH